MSELQTTGRRREVGAELKRFRRRSEWPAYRLAEKLDWTPSHISRSEAGKRRVTDVDAAHYLGMCGATEHELRDLLTLVNEPDDYRLQRHQGRSPDQSRTLTFLESTATRIDSFEPSYISGVAQTPDYARALLHDLAPDDPARLDRLVQLRMSRQEMLTRTNPPQCVYLIHEHALRLPVGGPQVMREQLRHLLVLVPGDRCGPVTLPGHHGTDHQRLSERATIQSVSYYVGNIVTTWERDSYALATRPPIRPK